MPNDHVRNHSNSPPLPPPKTKRRRRATTMTMSMRTGGDEDDIINDSIDDSNNTINKDDDIMVPPIPRRRHSRRPQLRRQMRSHQVKSSKMPSGETDQRGRLHRLRPPPPGHQASDKFVPHRYFTNSLSVVVCGQLYTEGMAN